MISGKHTHTCLKALCPGLPGWASTRKVKPIWILLKQQTVSGSGISWAIGKSAPCSRQITTPTPHHSVFYRPDALAAAQPTASKHWRHDLRKSKRELKEWTHLRPKIENCISINTTATEYITTILLHCITATYRKQWIRPKERLGRVWMSHVAALLTLTFASCNAECTCSWYGAEDDCSRVLTTSSGQVMTAPTVPPTLRKTTSSQYCKHF